MKYTKYSDFSAAFHSTIKSIKFLNERTEIDVLRHDSSPYPSTARAKLIFHSDVRSEWTAIIHDTYLKLRQTRRKVLPWRQPQKITDYTNFTVAPKIVSTRTNERTRPVMSTDRTRCRCSHHLPCTAIRFYCGNKIRIMRATNAPGRADEPEKRTAVFAREYKFSVFPGGQSAPGPRGLSASRSNELGWLECCVSNVDCK